MAEPLKDCPFCGGEARMTFALTALGREYSVAECKECGARTGNCKSKNSATKHWNRRVTDGKSD